MNYPIWDIPAPGLFIATIAIVHVFISHFAVGGGLFLVVTERKARRDNDAALLAYVERHSRFFVLLTLVAGALTGVGIWFTIALVNPSATASLISTFVWGWAIEWTFFAVEIAAAIVYYYGWRRLDPRTHMRVGWAYFWSAWLSLVVINGILSYMLTPGQWLVTRGFWDGFLNPTYFPSVLARTAGAVGLAGVYALLTATWMSDAGAKARIARYAAVGWVLPAAVLLPLTFAWLLAAANVGGTPIAEVFGATGTSLPAVLQAAFTGGAASGHPIAQRALVILTLASIGLVALTLGIAWRASAYGRPTAVAAMACAFLALGAAEWLREDLRKPYVIGQYMLVNGIRVAPPAGALAPPGTSDRFAADAISNRGIVASALWARPVRSGGSPVEDEIARGREVFRLACAACHTTDGYLALRPLVRGMTISGAHGVVARLATWRGRRMPPFTGTEAELDSLSVYLASLGGASPAELAAAHAQTEIGAKLFDENCSPCHGPDASVPFTARGRSAAEFYSLIGDLPRINRMMPMFEGSDQERHELAEYVATLDGGRPQQGGAR